jgi:hypothetical protein
MLSVIAGTLSSIPCVRMQPQKLLDVSELTQTMATVQPG